MPKKKLIRALESDNFTIYSHEDGYLMYDNDKKGVTMNTAYDNLSRKPTVFSRGMN